MYSDEVFLDTVYELQYITQYASNPKVPKGAPYWFYAYTSFNFEKSA